MVMSERCVTRTNITRHICIFFGALFFFLFSPRLAVLQAVIASGNVLLPQKICNLLRQFRISNADKFQFKLPNADSYRLQSWRSGFVHYKNVQKGTAKPVFLFCLSTFLLFSLTHPFSVHFSIFQSISQTPFHSLAHVHIHGSTVAWKLVPPYQQVPQDWDWTSVIGCGTEMTGHPSPRPVAISTPCVSWPAALPCALAHHPCIPTAGKLRRNLILHTFQEKLETKECRLSGKMSHSCPPCMAHHQKKNPHFESATSIPPLTKHQRERRGRFLPRVMCQNSPFSACVLCRWMHI